MIRYRNVILMESLVLLSEGKPSFEIQDQINRFLPPKSWIDLSKQS